MYNKSKWTLVVIVLFFILSCSGSSGSGGGGGGDDAVSVNTLDGTADVPIGSTFAYTFSEAVDSATVTSSTFFIVSMPQQGGGDEPQGADAIVRKTEYDDTICNADNALTASVGYTAADLQATLDPESDLSYNTSYAICLTTGITYASGSAFEGFMALFNTEALQCDNSSITTYSYMMAFQSCDPDEDCSDPRNHMLYLAGSNDGASWSLIEEFESISGSVPGLVFYNDYLYIFHT